MEFKIHADKIIKERWGIEVEHTRAKRTYEDRFYTIRTEKAKKRPGMIYGWPFSVTGAWCNSDVKMPPLKAIEKGGNIVYIGIAVDEPNRFHNLTETKKSPLVEAGWTEADCRRWCEENNLLSPIYTTGTRGYASLKEVNITTSRLLLLIDIPEPFSRGHENGHTQLVTVRHRL